MKISCAIPSSRELPLALNLGTPVVISEPRSAAAKQLQQLAAGRTTPSRPKRHGRGGGDEPHGAHQPGPAGRRGKRGEVAGKWRQAPNRPLAVDGLGDFKAKVHDSLFERLGTRLFESSNEDQLQSLVMAEIGASMEATETALSPEERQHLVHDIALGRHGSWT